MSTITNPQPSIEKEKPVEKFLTLPEKQLEALPRPERTAEKLSIESDAAMARAKEKTVPATTPGLPKEFDLANRHLAERQQEIEEILAEDLADIYASLDPATKIKFKQAGEETARAINTLLDKAKFKARQVIDLLKKWLSLIPGINLYFLEQEVKIKTDKIMKMRHDKTL